MKRNNKGWASRLIMMCILVVLLLGGWMYMKKLAVSGKLDPEIAKVIQDPVGSAREAVGSFNQKTQERMDSLSNYG